MQLKHPLLIVAIALALLNIAGCASSGSTESLDNIQQQLLGDMPLPQGSKISNEQSLILGGGPQWTGRIVIVSLTAAPKGGTAPVNLNSQPASR